MRRIPSLALALATAASVAAQQTPAPASAPPLDSVSRFVEALAQQGGRALHAGYEFCVRSRVTYEYSDAVAEAEARVAELKRQEQQQGIARVRSYTEFPYVRAL